MHPDNFQFSEVAEDMHAHAAEQEQRREVMAETHTTHRAVSRDMCQRFRAGRVANINDDLSFD